MNIAIDKQFEVKSIDVNSEKRYELRVLLCPEDTGFSIHSLNLPGVLSQGETEAEAVTNITEAFQGALLEYNSLGNAIPWGDVSIDDAPRGSKELWIVVNV